MALSPLPAALLRRCLHQTSCSGLRDLPPPTTAPSIPAAAAREPSTTTTTTLRLTASSTPGMERRCRIWGQSALQREWELQVYFGSTEDHRLLQAAFQCGHFPGVLPGRQIFSPFKIRTPLKHQQKADAKSFPHPGKR